VLYLYDVARGGGGGRPAVVRGGGVFVDLLVSGCVGEPANSFLLARF